MAPTLWNAAQWFGDWSCVCVPPLLPPTLSVRQISLCLFIGCHWSLKLPNTVYVCMRVLMRGDYARTLIWHRFVGYTHTRTCICLCLYDWGMWASAVSLCVPDIRGSTLPTFAQCYMYNRSSSATIHLWIEEKENSILLNTWLLAAPASEIGLLRPLLALCFITYFQEPVA